MLCALITKSADCVVNTSEVLIDCVVQSISAVSKSVSLLVELRDESLLVYSRPYICLCSTRSTSASVSSAVAAESVSKSIATPAKQEQNDDPILLS